MSHYRERLELLQRLAGRLEAEAVPCLLKHHVPAAASGSREEETVPALRLGARLGWVRVLYWRPLSMDESRPFFVWFDSVSRFPADRSGIDRLAAIIALMWRDRRTDYNQENGARLFPPVGVGQRVEELAGRSGRL